MSGTGRVWERASARRRLLVGLLGVMLLAAPIAAGLRDVYGRALDAMEAGDWQHAERLFKEAVAIRSEEARRLPLRRIFRPYLPHYYLGAVLAGQGDCRGALAEWTLSSQHRAITAAGLAGELARRRTACEDRLARLTELQIEIRAEFGVIAEKSQRLADPGRAHLLRFGYESGFGSLGQRLESAQASLAEARSQLARAEANQDPELAEATLQLARETSLLLDEALEEFDRVAERFAAARTERLERSGEVRDLALEVRGLLRGRSPLPPVLRGRRQEIESLLSVATDLPASVTLEQIDGLERRLETFHRQLQSSAPPPPGALRSGAIAFLRADYELVLERLDEIPYSDDKTRAHCLLLRSAAAFALHVAGGEVESELLERAREDVLAAKASDPDLEPAESAFSPRFVRFFEAVSAAVPGA